MSDANDLIMGSSVTGAKFATIGDLVQGTIARISDKQQARKFKKDGIGELDTWEDGQPIWQVRFDLQTDVRDPSIQGDDGIRAIYVRAGSELRRVIAEAVRAAGAKEILINGFLGVQFIGEEESGAGNPKKLYAAVYRPPNPGSQMLMGADHAAQNVQNGAAPVVYQQPAQMPAQPAQWQPPAQPAQMPAQPPHAPTQPPQWAPPMQAQTPVTMQSAQEDLQRAQQQYGIPAPHPTMQHPSGQVGMQQPANPANDPKVQQLLSQVDPNRPT